MDYVLLEWENRQIIDVPHNPFVVSANLHMKYDSVRSQSGTVQQATKQHRGPRERHGQLAYRRILIEVAYKHSLNNVYRQNTQASSRKLSCLARH